MRLKDQELIEEIKGLKKIKKHAQSALNTATIFINGLDEEKDKENISLIKGIINNIKININSYNKRIEILNIQLNKGKRK